MAFKFSRRLILASLRHHKNYRLSTSFSNILLILDGNNKNSAQHPNVQRNRAASRILPFFCSWKLERRFIIKNSLMATENSCWSGTTKMIYISSNLVRLDLSLSLNCWSAKDESFVRLRCWLARLGFNVCPTLCTA